MIQRKCLLLRKEVISSHKERTDMTDKKYTSKEDFRLGFAKPHTPFQGKSVNQQAPRKDFKGKWLQRRQWQPLL